nr:C39 family peptidase [Micromonospora sp. DSM 115978]
MDKGALTATGKILDVPYRGQQFDPDEWRSDGFRSADDARYWSRRSCGVACVGMVLDFYGGEGPPLSSLLREGIASGGYGTRGWIHAALARLLTSHGVPAESAALRTADEIAGLVGRGLPFVASVGDEFPDDGTSGGHLVVVKGVSEADGHVSAVHF